MIEAIGRIKEWSEKIGESTPAPWDRLPEIYLYMDQVITYMNQQLNLFERNENSTLLTSSMINNYVKDGVLERPSRKKYSRDHLAMLTVICMLKQVLSIPDIASLLKATQGDSGEKRKLYEEFCTAQSDALNEVCGRVNEAADQGEDALRTLAVTLSIEAGARRIASERILSELAAEKEE